MTQDDRRYISLDGFSTLVRTSKEPKNIETSKLAVVSTLPAKVKALGGEDSRMIEFVITTARVDREQDTIATDGWDFADYQNNPVVLWCHDHYSPVIANSRSLTVVDGGVKSIAEFTPADLNPFGYMIYRLYAASFMHAVSVGFQPMEYTIANDRNFGINYIKQSLLEYSCCPVPANPDALAVARSKGIDLKPMRDWAEQMLDEKSGLSDDARRRMEILRASSVPTGRALILELGDIPMADDNKNSPPSAVKRVERWECGTEGHVHTTEGEAKSCAEWDASVTDVTKNLQMLQGHIKSGKTLKKEAAALLRSVVDEIAPAEQLPADPSKEEDEAAVIIEEDGKSVELSDGDLEDITKAVRAAVTEKFNKLTGRLN